MPLVQMQSLTLIAAYCDSCLEPLVVLDVEASKAEVRPMVCGWGVTVCMSCADYHGIVTRNTLSDRGRWARVTRD